MDQGCDRSSTISHVTAWSARRAARSAYSRLRWVDASNPETIGGSRQPGMRQIGGFGDVAPLAQHLRQAGMGTRIAQCIERGFG
jgi:hypothetical protein